ncbi:pro-sigmaK processing inhibitor BofA [Alkalibaculum sp. M08DMB]|uniref:Pro-sigmaK processing inhibitor BofA n=1 Tax=Alkalibaculum sporogenes TaxID=2655001 RepID=A0A6A7KAZ5_9FIRM|nr:pro-sigmaK processing inhibitor BofA family protein [Alkalibaculum sporogenes]MPW26203.1 pro-sigmaK processing inhibitor BofA [Alkalibaculum sporogenes]
MGIGLETDAVLAYSIGLLLLYLLGSSLMKIFKVPVKIIMTIFINSILGGLILFILNIFGQAYNFQIGINPLNALTIGVLGIPGLIMLIILKMIL